MLVPLQSVEFLGFIVDSVEMIVSLPERKINQLREQSASLWEKPQCSSRELLDLMGLIVSSFPAIRPVRLYYRDLEVCKLEALSVNDGDYNSMICLSETAKAALQWFISSCHLHNRTSFKKPSTIITLTTDASQSGWGVVCMGVSTSGLWSLEEQTMHIKLVRTYCYSFWCEMFSSIT